MAISCLGVHLRVEQEAPFTLVYVTAETTKEAQVRAFYRVLMQAWGAQHWWPARTCFEVIVGAYLTQNTAWTNVERALTNLRHARLLTVAGIRRVPLRKLEQLIRPAGYFRQKARRLKTFISFLDERYAGSLASMLAQPAAQLRRELLALNGVGPETADSILLYSGNQPVFVVDAYTRRIVERHGILPAKADYEEIRALFERALAEERVAIDDSPAGEARFLTPVRSDGDLAQIAATGRGRDAPKTAAGTAALRPLGAAHPPSPVSTAKRAALVQVYNEMHALLVGVGKRYCLRAEARCESCPLRVFLP